MLEFHRMGWFRFSGLGVQATVGHTAVITQVLRRGLILSRSDSLALALAPPPRGVSVRCQRESAASPRARLCVPFACVPCVCGAGVFPNLKGGYCLILRVAFKNDSSRESSRNDVFHRLHANPAGPRYE